VLDPSTSVWLAFGIGLATLGVQGARYARLERLGGTALAVSVLLNVGLGLVLVLLKVLVMH
jgi:hypothetical protein